MRKINVAISIHLSRKPGTSIWSNGANQHAVFLYLLIRHLPYVTNVFLATNDSGDVEDKWLLDDFKSDVAPLDTIIEKVDLLIELSASVSAKHVSSVRSRGGRYVACRVGNDIMLMTENIVFDAHNNWFPNPNNLKADAIWTNAQHEHSCGSFFEVIFSSKVAILPHLWSPFFLKKALVENPRSALGWPYSKKTDKVNISIFEPNIGVVKTTLIPFLIAAEYYKKYKLKVSNIFMYNALGIKDRNAFKKIVMNTEAGKDGIATAEMRYRTVDALGQEGGIVVSHQLENGLNYLYYEALYGGFPLVHNSPFLKDIGYYYEGFNIWDGVKALERAVHQHNETRDEYDLKAKGFLKSVDPNQKRVIDAYDIEIRRLFA